MVVKASALEKFIAYALAGYLHDVRERGEEAADVLLVFGGPGVVARLAQGRLNPSLAEVLGAVDELDAIKAMVGEGAFAAETDRLLDLCRAMTRAEVGSSGGAVLGRLLEACLD